jgi:hypothetical protein
MAAGLKMSAALAMGNSVVIKPSELSPLGTHRLVELLHEAGIPEGVCNWSTDAERPPGAALAEHPRHRLRFLHWRPDCGRGDRQGCRRSLRQGHDGAGRQIGQYRARRRTL